MNLSGKLAPEIGQLSHVTILNFAWNNLTGSIPKEIGNISALKALLLNGNKLSGSLPDELGNLSNLVMFQVNLNHISGQIPKSFANLSSVIHLHFNNISLSGQIPFELSQLPKLRHLLLDNNNLTGKIPPEFAFSPELRILQLDNNNFQGSEIPASYGSFSKLTKLSLRNCSLQGTIPDFGSIHTLHYLDLSWNNLTGPLPPRLSDNITTIVLSDNHLNGTIPESFSSLPNLQRLSLENNLLTGAVPNDIWRNISFNSSGRLDLDLRNNKLSNITGNLNPPANVNLRLGGNPICSDSKLPNISQFCGSNSGNEIDEGSANYTSACPVQACPTDDFFEYVPQSPVPCFCASPLRVGCRFMSPSFSYFPPFMYPIQLYATSGLNLERYQLSIDSYAWEAGPRLRMYLKVFPAWDNVSHSNTFNQTEVRRLIDITASPWNFPVSDVFGPYEILNFTLLGPYSRMNVENPGINISKGELAAIVVGVVIFAAAVSAIVTLLMTRRQARDRRRLSQKHTSSRVSMELDGVKSFTFEEMALATDYFNSSMQVGQGGYGKVYRGILTDKTMVAIKRAEAGSLQGQNEFLMEIKLLSRLHHRNLVSLVGYCDEEEEQMLVYEFMPNGTLRDWLSGRDNKSLDFRMRLSVAMDSAKGILYLHTEANPPVFHRDIKASNILLDSKFTAKVADFGLSRLAPVLDDAGNLPNYVSTVVKGTPGYLDPEYFLTHKLTDKSDVYSLGIVFLELLTGLQPISHGKNIVREVNMAYKSGSMFSIIDSRMGSYPSECVEKFVELAISCCHDNPEMRPSMASVVRELENIVKMMPEATLSEEMCLESKTGSDGNPSTSSFASTSYYGSREVYGLSSGIVSGSDLSSGVVPTISPR